MQKGGLEVLLFAYIQMVRLKSNNKTTLIIEQVLATPLMRSRNRFFPAKATSLTGRPLSLCVGLGLSLPVSLH